MAAPDSGQEAPQDFVEQVAEALRHLYKPSLLLRSPLVERLLPGLPAADARGLPQRRGQRLRTLLLESLESLSPGPKVAFRSPAARSYQALHLHYVDGHTVDEVARLLALSQRQAYRDIRKGEADLAALLWQLNLAQASLAAPKAAQSAGHMLRQEVRRLPLRPSDVSLAQALGRAAEPLAGLLSTSAIALDIDLDQDYLVRVDREALHRCLTACFSLAVQACQGWPAGAAVVRVTARGADAGVDTGPVHVSLRGRPLKPGRLADLANLLAVARALCEALDGAAIQFDADQQQAELRLLLPISPPTSVMVIDDNEGLTELFRRYLGQAGYTVLEASDGAEGLRLARQRHPEAIVLDILMPGVDGWALLAQLKADSATADIAVVVCSVFDDPGLAESLGATACIAKPAGKDDLLAALARALEQDAPAAERPRTA